MKFLEYTFKFIGCIICIALFVSVSLILLAIPGVVSLFIMKLNLLVLSSLGLTAGFTIPFLNFVNPKDLFFWGLCNPIGIGASILSAMLFSLPHMHAVAGILVFMQSSFLLTLCLMAFVGSIATFRCNMFVFSLVAMAMIVLPFTPLVPALVSNIPSVLFLHKTSYTILCYFYSHLILVGSLIALFHTIKESLKPPMAVSHVGEHGSTDSDYRVPYRTIILTEAEPQQPQLAQLIGQYDECGFLPHANAVHSGMPINTASARSF